MLNLWTRKAISLRYTVITRKGQGSFGTKDVLWTMAFGVMTRKHHPAAIIIGAQPVTANFKRLKEGKDPRPAERTWASEVVETLLRDGVVQFAK